MSWDSFKQIRDGTRILNHGYDQCVAVFNRFHEGVLGKPFVPVASASQLWTAFDNYPALRTNYRKSSTPVAGAVMVWDRSWGGGHGHVEVVLATHSDGTITTLGQNSTHRWTHRYRRPRRMPGLLGYLIPKGTNPAVAAPPKPPKKKGLAAMQQFRFDHAKKQVMKSDRKWRALRVKDGRSYIVNGPAKFTGSVNVNLTGLDGTGEVRVGVRRAGFLAGKSRRPGRFVAATMLKNENGDALVNLGFAGHTGRMWGKYFSRIYVEVHSTQKAPVTVTRVRAEGLFARF